MTAKHTPGPWVYRPFKHDDWGFVRNGAGDLIARASGPTTAAERNAHREAKTDPYKANARLIAAAPAMLEALKDCLGYVDENWLKERIRAALKLAEES